MTASGSSSAVMRSRSSLSSGLPRDDDGRAVGRAEQSLARVEPQVGLALVVRRGRGTDSTSRRGSGRMSRLKSTSGSPAAATPGCRPGQSRVAAGSQGTESHGSHRLDSCSVRSVASGGLPSAVPGGDGERGRGGGLILFGKDARPTRPAGVPAVGSGSPFRISWISGCFQCRIRPRIGPNGPARAEAGPTFQGTTTVMPIIIAGPRPMRKAEYTYRDRMLIITRGSPLPRGRDTHSQRGRTSSCSAGTGRRSGWSSPSPARARSTPKSRWTRCSTARATTGTSGSTACPRSSATATGSTGPGATGTATTPT